MAVFPHPESRLVLAARRAITEHEAGRGARLDGTRTRFHVSPPFTPSPKWFPSVILAYNLLFISPFTHILYFISCFSIVYSYLFVFSSYFYFLSCNFRMFFTFFVFSSLCTHSFVFLLFFHSRLLSGLLLSFWHVLCFLSCSFLCVFILICVCLITILFILFFSLCVFMCFFIIIFFTPFSKWFPFVIFSSTAFHSLHSHIYWNLLSLFLRSFLLSSFLLSYLHILYTFYLVLFFIVRSSLFIVISFLLSTYVSS